MSSRIALEAMLMVPTLKRGAKAALAKREAADASDELRPPV